LAGFLKKFVSFLGSGNAAIVDVVWCIGGLYQPIRTAGSSKNTWATEGNDDHREAAYIHPLGYWVKQTIVGQ
jgi:hypothetical protein